jgi:hypothetical protein
MPCMCNSEFVFNFKVLLLDLLVCCNVPYKQNFVRKNFENSFQYELIYMYNF